ncbi:MAG: MarR family transcriptional regulator [Pseudorhodoplanes sp.]
MKAAKIPAVSRLEAHLGYWLRFVSNQVSHNFDRKLAALDVSVAEWVVLRELFEGDPLVPSELAKEIGMTRGAVSKIMDRLEAKSLLTRATNERDRRFQTVTVSAKGRALVPRLAALADQNDREFFGHLKPGERQQIERVMREIVRRHGLSSVPVD